MYISQTLLWFMQKLHRNNKNTKSKSQPFIYQQCQTHFSKPKISNSQYPGKEGGKSQICKLTFEPKLTHAQAKHFHFINKQPKKFQFLLSCP